MGQTDFFESAGLTGYERFWPVFLSVHQHPWTRVFHGVATVFGLGCALLAFPLTLNAAWLFIGLGVSYPIAWFSHAVFEKKRPAAFSHPYWSFLCDLDMLAHLACGSLEDELRRLRLEPHGAPAPAWRAWHAITELGVCGFVLAVAWLTVTGQVQLSPPF